jgi:hypothetical protein
MPRVRTAARQRRGRYFADTDLGPASAPQGTQAQAQETTTPTDQPQAAQRVHFPSAGISMSSLGEDAKRQHGWERTRLDEVDVHEHGHIGSSPTNLIKISALPSYYSTA